MSKVLFFICFSFISFQAFAQNIKISVIDTVRITASTNSQVEKPEPASATISVLDREFLESVYDSEILTLVSKYIPGLFVTQRGVTGFGLSGGSAGIVNIRGTGGGNKVLMLFDGQPQWAGIFGHALPDTYSISDAEQIKITRGPASLNYGSGAMGGAINIVTHKPLHEGFYGRGRAMYGSYNTQKYTASIGGKDKKISAFASLNYDYTDGHRKHSEFGTTNASAKIAYDFSNHWQASSGVLMDFIDSHNPGTIQKPMLDGRVEALRTTYSVAVENKYKKMSGAIQTFYNWGKHKINNGHGIDENPQLFLFNSTDYSTGGSVYETFRLFKGNSTTAGIDYKQWGGHAWNDTISNHLIGEIIDKSVNEFAFYIFTQQTIKERLIIDAGIRMEKNKLYGKEWIPRFGLTYSLTENTGFKVAVSKGFRSPNIRDLYMYPQANPDLKPEYMINYDISYLQRLFNNQLNLELTAYYIDGKDIIQVVMENGRPRNLNTGSFTNKGFELSAGYKINSTLHLTANYSFLDADVPLIAAPKHKALLNVDWKIGKFRFSPDIQYIGKLYTSVEPGKLISDNYALLNTKITYKLSQRLSFFVNGENLTNAGYEINYGFPMPGVVVLGGIDLKFN